MVRSLLLITTLSLSLNTSLLASEGYRAYQTCPPCEITLSKVASLGDSEGPGIVGSLTTVARLPDGRIALSYDEADTEVVIFRADGAFDRKIGRRGDGPGEFQFVRWIRVLGDRMHVFDTRAQRATLFSSEFEVVSTSRFEGSGLGGVAVVNDSTAVMNSMVMSPQRVGFLLHAFSLNNGSIASFAEDPAGFRYDVSAENYVRLLTPSSSGGVWAAHRTRYRIEEWTSGGQRRRTIERSPAWFAPHAATDIPHNPNRPALPRIIDVQEDPSGLIWILLRVAAANWGETLVRADSLAHPEIAGRYVVSDANRSYDTVIEVIDPETRAVVASARFDELLLMFSGRGEVASQFTRADLTPEVRIWRVSLSPSQR